MKLELKRKVGFQVDGAGLGDCRGRESWGATEKGWKERSGACSQKCTELMTQFGFSFLSCLFGAGQRHHIQPRGRNLEKKTFIFLSTLQQILRIQRTKQCIYKDKHNIENQCFYRVSCQHTHLVEGLCWGICFCCYYSHGFMLWYTTIKYSIEPNSTSKDSI